MKRNDITALHTQTLPDLKKKLDELLVKVTKHRLERKVGKLENTKLVSSLRKDIARLKTVMTQKEMEVNV
jgi:large subunit ribosomal protein L29